jgi:5-methylcytosine-specific restriction enzyme B
MNKGEENKRKIYTIYYKDKVIYNELYMTKIPYKIVEHCMKLNQIEATFEDFRNKFSKIKEIISKKGPTQFLLEDKLIKGPDDTTNNRQSNYFNTNMPLLEYKHNNHITTFGVYTQWKNNGGKSNFHQFISEIKELGYIIEEKDNNEKIEHVIEVEDLNNIGYEQLHQIIKKILDKQSIKISDLGISEDEFNDSKWFDMGLIKNLAASNVGEKGTTSSNQASIILTGEDLEIFPCLRRSEICEKVVGRQITLKIPVKLMEKNIMYLREEDYTGENNVIETYFTTNEATQNRVELGTKRIDGAEYIQFYNSLYENCKLIAIKLRAKFQYIFFAIKPEDANEYLGDISLSKSVHFFDYINKVNKKEQVGYIDETCITIEKNYELESKGFNRLVYGAPGTGKSFKLDEDREDFFKEDNYERVTFYPDYSYGQFVGMYKPVSDGVNIQYKFTPGPFTRVLAEALKNENEDYLLIIEEINRANAAAVFGDMFQLMDRNSDGEGEYDIALSEDFKKYFKDEHNLELTKIKIPSNLYIWATMNTADQGVSPIDSAFKRRFDTYELMKIDEGEDECKIDVNIKCNNIGYINWNDFRKRLNTYLVNRLSVKEDKLIGPFFIKPSVLSDDKKFQRAFKDKLLMYLAEDVLKHKRNSNSLFSTTSLSHIHEIYDAKEGESTDLFVSDFVESLVGDK